MVNGNSAKAGDDDSPIGNIVEIFPCAKVGKKRLHWDPELVPKMREPGQIDALMAANVDLGMTVGEEHPPMEASGRSNLVIGVSF